MRPKFNWLFLFVAASTMMLSSCSCSDTNDNTGGTQDKNAPVIQVDPTEITFAAIMDEGDEPSSSEQILKLENIGHGELRINDIVLEDISNRLSIVYPETAGLDIGCPDIANGPFTIAPITEQDNYCMLKVRFEPSADNASSISGKLTIQNNDAKNGQLIVPIGSIKSGPDIHIDPPTVFFTDVLAGEVETQELIVTNRGTQPLIIDSISLTNISSPFTWAFTEDSRYGDSELADGLTLRPISTHNDDVVKLEIKYQPIHSGSDFTDLVFESNSVDNHTVMVPITAGSLEPCVDIIPFEVDFREVLIGTTISQPVNIHNCGNTDLVLKHVGIKEGTHQFYQLRTDSVPADFACENSPTTVCTGELRLHPGENHSVQVTFSPENDSPASGNLEVKVKLVDDEDYTIPLTGIGTDNSPPRAVAEVRVEGSPQFGIFETEANALETIPLKTIELRGSNSTDADGTIENYRWNVCARPTDSAAQIAPNSNQADVTFFLDLAGVYCFELEVWDDHGVACNEKARAWVSVTPEQDIHIQLMWLTPNGPGLDHDQGTDLDVHLVRSPYLWYDDKYDCYYSNKTPDWAIPGTNIDDPSLDIDDLRGPGPENINLDNPETGVTYKVGVHYWQDNGNGVSYATVRIYIQGQMQLELQNKPLEMHEFWDVATIDWPSGQITERGNVFPFTPPTWQ